MIDHMNDIMTFGRKGLGKTALLDIILFCVISFSLEVFSYNHVFFDVLCSLYLLHTLPRLSKVLACAAGALERAHEEKKGLEASSTPFTRSPHAIQKLTIKLTGSYHAGCQGTLGDKNALHNTNSVIKGVCSIHSRLRSVYIYLGLFLANRAHLWTYTRERRPPLVPEVTHCGQSFTYFGLRISYRSVRTVSK